MDPILITVIAVLASLFAVMFTNIFFLGRNMASKNDIQNLRSEMRDKFKGVESRFENKFKDIESKMDKQSDKTDRKIDNLDRKIDNIMLAFVFDKKSKCLQ